MKRFASAVALCGLLAGCLGYHIGPAQPDYLRDVHKIAIPTFENRTFLPRIEVLVTDSVIKQFQQDGTYRIVDKGDADATLEGEITRIDRIPARSVPANVLATAEFNLAMRVRYKLVARDGRVLTQQPEVTGTTSFFVGTDVTTDERQALPLAAEELANRLVTQVSEGW